MHRDISHKVLLIGYGSIGRRHVRNPAEGRVPGLLAPQNRKPVFGAFLAFCRRTEEGAVVQPSVETPLEIRSLVNEHIINAFCAISNAQGLGNWGLLEQAGLDLRQLVAHRRELYTGPALEEMANLTEEQRDHLGQKLVECVEEEREVPGAGDFLIGQAAPDLLGAHLVGHPGQPRFPAGGLAVFDQ